MDVFFQQVINGLVMGSMYALVALGYTMVYGIIGLINFAHGDVLMVGALTSWTIIGWMSNASPDLPGWMVLLLATLIAMVVCGALNYTIEKLAYRPLRNSPRLAPLITAKVQRGKAKARMRYQGRSRFQKPARSTASAAIPRALLNSSAFAMNPSYCGTLASTPIASAAIHAAPGPARLNFSELSRLPPLAWPVAGLVVWMAAWWMSEALPLSSGVRMPSFPFSSQWVMRCNCCWWATRSGGGVNEPRWAQPLIVSNSSRQIKQRCIISRP